MNAATHIANERGIGLISTVIVITALLALTVVGVGIGRHSFTATEVQTVAEAAATAGATALLNGLGSGTAKSQGQLVAEQNYVEGNLVTASMIPLDQIEPGNFSSGGFSAGSLPLNAVRATANATMSNVFSPLSFAVAGGGFSSSGQYTVTKTAIASFTGLGGGRPNLPIALCQACFPSDCYSSDCLPRLTNVPSPTNTVAWTGFTEGSSQATVTSFLPTACQGGGATPPDISAGTDSNPGTPIQLNNGQITPALRDIHCMVCNLGMCTETAPCLVPVFRCTVCGGPLNQSEPVVGFAEVVINSFNYTNGAMNVPCGGQQNASVQSINLKAIFKSDVTGPPGGGIFGVGFIVLVG